MENVVLLSVASMPEGHAPWDKGDLVAECEWLRARLLSRMDEVARERCREIEQYFSRMRELAGREAPISSPRFPRPSLGRRAAKRSALRRSRAVSRSGGGSAC
jgi:hypothetical protein